MARYRGDRVAFGRPGLEPRWTHGDKDGVGCALSRSSRIWFTIWRGILTEVYYPTVDRPQIRDLEYLITDGRSFLHEEKRDLVSKVERLSDHTLGYQITNTDPQGRYTITKEVISDPSVSCILQRTKLTGSEDFLSRLHLYALCCPHLEVGGWGNSAYVVEVSGHEILVAEKNGTWVSMMATIPFSRLSCGYVGYSDGWQDIATDFQMDWEFDRAPNGHVSLIGELPMRRGNREFILGLALGNSLHNSVTTLFEALGLDYTEQHRRYREQWDTFCQGIASLERVSEDEGNLYFTSYSLLISHEDKTYPGAFIASMSIPWGEARGDNDMGGYHLVWTRDMVNSATGMLAAGNKEVANRALLYLAASQQSDGGFPQNFWIDGSPYWQGIQLDEVAFPIMLAWRLRTHGFAHDFDVYPMVVRGAAYLIAHGPATQQERWEEASGYSPSTLASNIAALVCAADFARERDDETTARFLEDYADFLEGHVESWTVTTQGALVPGIPRHYIRIHPVDISDPRPDEDPNHGMLMIRNRPPGSQWEFPAKDIVDAGFLELARYGIRKPGDPLIEDSLRVIDVLLKVETQLGPCWRRYNNDGYGQREDGGPYQGWGKGRAWPLLTGERGHYEFAAGRDVAIYIRAMEAFSSVSGLLPEQVWDEPDRPQLNLYQGRPTGSAMPLMWAHAEYVKLLRSVSDGQVFDYIPAVGSRYLSSTRRHKPLEVWKHNRQPQSVRRGSTFRVQAQGSFDLIWTLDEWRSTKKTPSIATALGIDFADIQVPVNQKSPLRFTFFWKTKGTWEGRNYDIAVI
jgi:glucoamylase